MSDDLVKRAREAATEARYAFAQDWFDAEETGERPDLMRIEAEIPVEWIEYMSDRIEELEAALSSIEIDHMLTNNGNLWRFWSNKANAIAEKNTTLGQKIEELEAKLAAHDAEVYRRGQEDMREQAAEAAYYEYWSADDASDLRAAIRAIPIKEKADE